MQRGVELCTTLLSTTQAIMVGLARAPGVVFSLHSPSHRYRQHRAGALQLCRRDRRRPLDARRATDTEAAGIAVVLAGVSCDSCAMSQSSALPLQIVGAHDVDEALCVSKTTYLSHLSASRLLAARSAPPGGPGRQIFPLQAPGVKSEKGPKFFRLRRAQGACGLRQGVM